MLRDIEKCQLFASERSHHEQKRRIISYVKTNENEFLAIVVDHVMWLMDLRFTLVDAPKVESSSHVSSITSQDTSELRGISDHMHRSGMTETLTTQAFAVLIKMGNRLAGRYREENTLSLAVCHLQHTTPTVQPKLSGILLLLTSDWIWEIKTMF